MRMCGTTPRCWSPSCKTEGHNSAAGGNVLPAALVPFRGKQTLTVENLPSLCREQQLVVLGCRSADCRRWSESYTSATELTSSRIHDSELVIADQRALPAPGPQEKTVAVSPCSHPLTFGSLRQSRGGSLAEPRRCWHTCRCATRMRRRSRRNEMPSERPDEHRLVRWTSPRALVSARFSSKGVSAGASHTAAMASPAGYVRAT